MAYAVLETTDVLGNKEILAAPEGWVRCTNGKQYLCWPNVRNINSLNALLQDAHSVPSLMWEKHECVIKRSNLATLALATKAIDDMQNPSPEKGASANATSSSPAANTRKNAQKRLLDESTLDDAACYDADLLQEGAAPRTSQAMEMFIALQRLIEKNQEEMTKKMNEGFYRIQKTMVSLMHKRGDVEDLTDTSDTSNTVPAAAAPPAAAAAAAASPAPAAVSTKNYFGFNMKPLKTVEEMYKFEERLNAENYRKQVHAWIDSIVSYERNPEARMMEILDLMFDRHLLPLFSWTGTSTRGIKKRSFAKYRNIISLYAYTGTTSTHQADKLFVSQFFMKKLRHATTRAATLKGLRRCVPHSPGPRKIRTSKPDNSEVREVDGITKYVKISRVDYSTISEKVPSDSGKDCKDSIGNSSSNNLQTQFKQDSNDTQDVLEDDDEYIDFSNIELKPEEDMQPTLFMSADEESE